MKNILFLVALLFSVSAFGQSDLIISNSVPTLANGGKSGNTQTLTYTGSPNIDFSVADADSSKTNETITTMDVNGGNLRIIEAGVTNTVPLTSLFGFTGTLNRLPKFATTTTLGNSNLYDDGSDFGLGTDAPTTVMSGTPGGFIVHFKSASEQVRTVFTGTSSAEFLMVASAGATNKKCFRMRSTGAEYVIDRINDAFTIGTVPFIISTDDKFGLGLTGSGDILADFHAKGKGATSSTYTSLWENSSGTDLWKIRNDGLGELYSALNVGGGTFTYTDGVGNFKTGLRINNAAPAGHFLYSPSGTNFVSTSLGSVSALLDGNTGIVTIGSNDSTTIIESGGTPRITITDTGVISTPSGTIPSVLSNSATLDFIDTAPGECSNLTITVTGATDGDEVALGIPTASMPANGSFFAYVSGADTVTVRYCNNQLVGNLNPASGTFKVKVIK